jgi:hypothetical protein
MIQNSDDKAGWGGYDSHPQLTSVTLAENNISFQKSDGRFGGKNSF